MKKIFKKGIKILKKIKNLLFRKRRISIKNQLRNNEQISNAIKFSVVTVLYNTNPKFLKRMINSVIQQTYRNFEFIILNCSNDNKKIENICLNGARLDSRIVYKTDNNRGISKNFNTAVKNSTGDYLVFLDHDDELSIFALYYNAKAIYENNAKCLYSDETYINKNSRIKNTLYKPDFSLDLLYSQNYICHLLVIKKELFNLLGGFRSKYDGSQDYDLVLRVFESKNKIFHINKVLYKWRLHKSSTSLNVNSKPYCDDAGKYALNDHLKRFYNNSAYAENSEFKLCYNARFKQDRRKKISIIIPMKDKVEYSKKCIESILSKTTYNNYEIVIIDNNSIEEKTFNWFDQIKNEQIRILNYKCDFNWSKINNYGVANSKGEILVFLNNDTEIISSDWLDRINENVCRKDIGCVGGLLLYPDNTIQHAGVVVGINGYADHIYKFSKPYHHMFPFVSPVLSRNVLANTGALLAVEKKKFNKVGGFDERFIVCGSDVAFCIKLFENGYINMYNPNIRAYHYESKSRSSFIPDIDFKMSKIIYKPYLINGDPFYNNNLNYSSFNPEENNIYVY